MPQPLIIAHHLIWTAYGWWLPNDPRGSMSRRIATDVLKSLGSLHYGRKRCQPAGWQIRAFYEHAEPILIFPLIQFDAIVRNAIGDAFADTIAAQRYTCYACAIMRDHIHLIIRKHKHFAEDMIFHFQEESRSRLRKLNLLASGHPVWGGPGWKVFLDSPDDIRRTISYVENNPLEARLNSQRWSFVKPYDGWPLHPGHSPNSPYAKRLRGQE